jgi:hypothetical protein
MQQALRRNRHPDTVVVLRTRTPDFSDRRETGRESILNVETNV